MMMTMAGVAPATMLVVVVVGDSGGVRGGR
jgi:hypothetical protein